MWLITSVECGLKSTGFRAAGDTVASHLSTPGGKKKKKKISPHAG